MTQCDSHLSHVTHHAHLLLGQMKAILRPKLPLTKTSKGAEVGLAILNTIEGNSDHDGTVGLIWGKCDITSVTVSRQGFVPHAANSTGTLFFFVGTQDYDIAL